MDKLKVIRETCICGPVIERTIKMPTGNHKSKRANRTLPTLEKVEKNNERLAVKALTRKLNANCDSSWWHITLTYRNEPTYEEAQKNLKKFIDKARYEMKKLGLKFKWIHATEFENTRIHHHLLTNAPLELIRKLWNYGHDLPRPFDTHPNYEKLAEYIIKETSKQIRKGITKKRYSCSRNLIVPEVKREVVNIKELFDDPKPWKGYYIEQETLRRYENPVTGLEHLEYYMIALDIEKPRVKKYYKGKAVKQSTHVNIKSKDSLVQESFELLERTKNE